MTHAWLGRHVAPSTRLAWVILPCLSLATLPITPTGAFAGGGCAVLAWLLVRPPRFSYALLLAGLVTNAAVVAPALLAGSALTEGRWLRASATLTYAIAMGSTLSVDDVAAALRRWRAPSFLSSLMEVLARQRHALTEEAARLALARSLRGATGLGASLSLLAISFSRSVDRAERLALAARLRGGAPGLLGSREAWSWRERSGLAAALGSSVGVALLGRVPW